MHIHQSLVDGKTRRNLFMGKKPGQHSDLFSHYLGGLQKYIPMAMALLAPNRSEEHTSELQSLMRISYAVFCLKKKMTHRTTYKATTTTDPHTKCRLPPKL